MRKLDPASFRQQIQAVHNFLEGVQKLSGEELLALEDDLEFFDRTGLVGIYMSRILEVLEQNKICTSATELAA